MTKREKEIKSELEEIVARLEETRNSALEMRESNEMGLHGSNFNEDYTEDENIESALFEFGNIIEEIIQVIGEEIENMRNIIEKIDR